MRPIDADALKRRAITVRFFGKDIMMVPTAEIDDAPTIEPSEQYKKGFEDAKRAFELEYARESENMRKRNAELEVMLNAQKKMTAEPSGDLISREDAIDIINKTNSTLDEIPICKDIRNAFANAIKSLPSADRHTDESCRDCPLYDTDNHNCPRFNKVIPQTRAEMFDDMRKDQDR